MDLVRVGIEAAAAGTHLTTACTINAPDYAFIAASKIRVDDLSELPFYVPPRGSRRTTSSV